jgi:hypothetical protein
MKRFAAQLLILFLCLSFTLPAGAEKTANAEDVNGYTVGNIVIFGDYEQDNDKGNGEEPIEWIVLAVEGDQALLLSRYCLDARKYNTYTKKITWLRCSLRIWLNYTFFKDAFTPKERERILTTTVVNDATPGYDSYSCDDTEDPVFLLSYAEVLEYLPEQADRQALATAYAAANGAYVDEETGNSWWWLRSPGHNNSNACGVRVDGRVSGYGSREVSRPSGGIRPAIWLYIGE